MDLGNLSGLPKIPQYYLQFLLSYISQISVSLAHAHNHDLVHTNFNLSKVLIQNSESFKKRIHFEHNEQVYKYHITNFEPYVVYKYLKKNLKKSTANKLDLESVIQILKVKDLHAFANSILEIMVGQNSEMECRTP